MRLPTLPDAAPSEPPTRHHIAPREATPRRIPVVDDNRDTVDSLAMLLRLEGNDVHTAHDGPEAIGRTEALRPEVVLPDLGLPEMSGYEVCRVMRQRPWGQNLLIVAGSGWGQEEDKAKSRAAGFDAHLVKPVEPAALKRLLAATPAGAQSR